MFHWPLEFPEVIVKRGGFDAFVGNPPFKGGTKLQTDFGREWREHLVDHLGRGVRGVRGTADLCSYFLLRAHSLIVNAGHSGFVVTNTIAQGDTRLVGMDQLTQTATLLRAVTSRQWPGDASLQIAQIWLRLGDWKGPFILDDSTVGGITPYLRIPGVVSGNPYRLASNAGKCFAGSKVNGNGFILSTEEAESLKARSPRNHEVIFPYLTGDDINSSPQHKSGRFVINFVGWPLNHSTASDEYKGPVASDYPDCLRIVEERVKPERMKYEPKNSWNRKLRNEWWLFGQWRWAMSAAVDGRKTILICPVVTKYTSFVFDTPHTVFTHKVCIFTFENAEYLALLNSSIHDAWAREYSSTLGETLNYAPTSCFETFAFPTPLAKLRDCGMEYYEYRRQLMLSCHEGLTKTYNRFHDPEESSADIQKLRDLHVEMDQAVAAAYGWTDLDLGHGFHETKQGLRFTISEPARREVLQRLLKLNHERYAEEVKQGLHDNKKGRAKSGEGRGKKKKASQKQTSAGARTLFGDLEDEESDKAESLPSRPMKSVERVVAEAKERPPSIDELDTNQVMAAFRQAARGRGWLEREDMLRETAHVLDYQRLGPHIKETLKNHMRAALRRGILEADGDNVRAFTHTMDDYHLETLRDTLCSVMRKGTNYEREDVIHAAAYHLGFSRITETVRSPLKSAINSAIRQGVLGYEGSVIWRND